MSLTPVRNYYTGVDTGKNYFTGINDTAETYNSGVVDTGGNCDSGVIDTDKYCFTGVIDTGMKHTILINYDTGEICRTFFKFTFLARVVT